MFLNVHSTMSIVRDEWDRGCLELLKNSVYTDYSNLEHMTKCVWYTHCIIIKQTVLSYIASYKNLLSHFRCNNTQTQWLKRCTVMPEGLGCTQKYALQLNSVPNIQTTLTTAYGLWRKRTSKNWDSENWDCTPFYTIPSSNKSNISFSSTI